MRFLALLALAPLAACSTLVGPAAVLSAETGDWRSVATSQDRERLRAWRTAFTAALAKARAAGHGAEIDREGDLLRPDAALGGPPIPNGSYRCRVIKLGSHVANTLDFVAYQPFTCRIQPERRLQGFAKLTGSQRPVGLIFPDSPLRQVFLGTLVLGDETGARQYGRDPDRDLAAFVERIGPNTWRMIFPYPVFESNLDVIELIPVSGSHP